MTPTELSALVLSAWGPLAASAAFRVMPKGLGAVPAAEHRPDEPMEVGSCFKAFVAAACCRGVESGALRWDERLRLSPELRVPDSTAFGALPDGAEVTVREAAEAMIAVSDNTATDLLLDRVGADAVRRLLADAGLSATRVPTSVRSVYDQATAHPEGRAVACVSTMRELTQFYAVALRGDLFAELASLDAFKTILRQEDLDQGTDWPGGAVAYRKSGSLTPPPVAVSAIAGALEVDGARPLFAFACNAEVADADATTVVEPFTRGVSLALKGIAAGAA